MRTVASRPPRNQDGGPAFRGLRVLEAAPSSAEPGTPANRQSDLKRHSFGWSRKGQGSGTGAAAVPAALGPGPHVAADVMTPAGVTDG